MDLNRVVLSTGNTIAYNVSLTTNRNTEQGVRSMKSLHLLLILGAFLLTSVCMAEFEDFEDPIDPGVWTLLGDAFVEGGQLVLTNDIGSQAGAFYLNEQLDSIEELQASFDLLIQSPSVGADGAMFSIARAIEIGGNGGHMGWQGPGIYGVEFDTYVNQYDPSFTRHIAVVDSTTENHLTWFDFQFSANVWYHIDITIVEGNFQVLVDDTPVIQFDYVDYNSDQSAYLGVSAGTGGVFDSYVIDNLELIFEQGPVDLDLYGVVTTIPPQGGTLVYDATIISELPQAVTADAWTTVTFPNGQVFGPMIRLRASIPPGELSFTDLTQNIPLNAPEGEFYFSAYLGDFPHNPAVSDRITFYKTGVAATGIEGWDASTWGFAEFESTTVETPSAFTLHDAYPNPFNASTSVSVTLPQVSDLTVSVFNVMGQQVATLANGAHNAGQHTFSFDASNLSSGIYFIHATVQGEMNQIQKITLMK
jgi:Bacterial lectin/Secretion system C-terminal sorting domain